MYFILGYKMEVLQSLQQFLPLKSLVFVVHFLNSLWNGNKVFPKVSSQNEIVPLLVVFDLPCKKYKGVKIRFHSYCYQNQNFSLASHSCCSCSTRVTLVLHSCRWYLQCGTRVANVALVLHSCPWCRTFVARVSYSCCRLDQMRK